MWIYGRKRLAKRLALPEPIGFWLDYWLFLHMEITHSIWRNRPFGLRALAATALESNRGDSASLRVELKRLLIPAEEWMRLVPQLKRRPEKTLRIDGKEWTAEWLDWFRHISSDISTSMLVDRLSSTIANELLKGNLDAAAYYTRKLGEQSSDDEETAGLRVSAALNEFLGDKESVWPLSAAELAARIGRATLPEGELRSYKVRCSLMPASITKNKFRGSVMWDKFDVAVRANGEMDLVGLKVLKLAHNPRQAFAKALAEYVEILETLRVRYYLQTGIYGKIAVTCESDGACYEMPLPQPFWTTVNSTIRAVPQLPLDYKSVIGSVPEAERPSRYIEKWLGSRWHISSAFQKWPEDVHGAAAQVWYAIETFIGKVPDKIACKYELSVVDELLEFLASGVTAQKNAIVNDTDLKCDWRAWTQPGNVHDWLRIVSGRYAPGAHQFWSVPSASALVFAPKVGLIHMLKKAANTGNMGVGLSQRLRSDLQLLYVLRNKMAHEGRRIFSRQMAEYLGRLGLEVLFCCMLEERAYLMSLKPRKPPA